MRTTCTDQRVECERHVVALDRRYFLVNSGRCMAKCPLVGQASLCNTISVIVVGGQNYDEMKR